MKKILSSFLALFALGLSSPAWAQTDVTSTYLVGGSFENSTAATASATATEDANTTGETNGSWTYTSSSAWSCSAVVAYGQSDVLINNVAAPNADNAGNDGLALGVSVGWGGKELWQNTNVVTLPAGKYTLKYYAYNSNPDAVQLTSLVGFVTTAGDSYLSSKKSFTSGTWEEDYVNFTLNEATEGYFQVGGTAVGGGSGKNAKVFFDNLTLSYTEQVPELAEIAEGTYYLQNVATGKYFCGANSWGTHASINAAGLDVTLARLADGKYTIDTRLSNGGDSHYLSDVWCDGAATGHSFYAVEGADNTYYITTGNGYLASQDGSTDLVESQVQDEKAQWVLLTREERIDQLAEATKDNPIDATFLIQDPNFGRNDQRMSAWTITGKYNYPGNSDVSNYNIESYCNVFSISQTVDLPAGVYGMTVQGFYDQRGTDYDNLPVFYIGDKSATFPVLTGSENSMYDASVSFSAGKWTIDPIFVDIAGGATELGAKNEANTGLWCIWDNFQLTYYGTEVTADILENSIYYEQLAAAIAEATELLNDTTLAESKKDGLAEAIEAGEAAYDGLDLAAVKEATSALNAAIATPKSYKKYGDVLAQMKALTESTNIYTDEALNDYYTRWQAAYDDGTLTTEEGEALVDPYKVTGWHAGAQSLNTFLLDSWNTASANFDGYYINTWSTEGVSDGSNFKVPFFEYWTGDANTLNGKTLSATVYGVENGYYTVSAVVRVRLSDSAAGSAPEGITLRANKGEAVSVCEGTAYGQLYVDTVEVACTVTDGALTVRFDVDPTTNVSWLAYQQVKYTKVEQPVSDTLVVPITAEREVGQGYEPTTDVVVYFTDALEFLGIDSISKATVVGINMTDGTIVENAMALYDGWRNINGDFESWGGNSSVCVKFLPEEALFSICDRGGDVPVGGQTFTCKWALQANGKTVVYEIAVKFTAPEGTLLEIPVSAERYEGLGFQEQTIDVDLDAAMEFLGITDITEATDVAFNMSDGSLTDAMNAYDGWLNKQGDFALFGNESFAYAKFNPLHKEYSYVGDDILFGAWPYEGAPVAGDSITFKYGLQANGKTVVYVVTVKFIAKPVAQFSNLSELNVLSTVTVNHSMLTGQGAYTPTTNSFDADAIASALGLESLASAQAYWLSVTDNSLVETEFGNATKDGWRDANGDPLGWGYEGGVCVKITNPSSGVIDNICDYGTGTEGTVIHAPYVYANSNGDAVVLDVIVTYTTATGIQSLFDGQSLKNAAIYTLGGQRVSNVTKGGLYIVNGKKVLVK